MVSGYGCPIFNIQPATIVPNQRYRSLSQVWIIKGVCWGAVWQYMCTLLRKYLSIINSLVITSNSCTRQQTGGSTNKHLTGQSTRISQAAKYLRKCAISVLFLGLKVLARRIDGDSPSFPSGYSSKPCEFWIEEEIVWHDDTFGHVWSPRLKVGWWTRRKVKDIMRWWSKNLYLFKLACNKLWLACPANDLSCRHQFCKMSESVRTYSR